MYAIYGNIYHPYTPNVSIYTIHGSVMGNNLNVGQNNKPKTIPQRFFLNHSQMAGENSEKFLMIT